MPRKKITPTEPTLQDLYKELLSACGSYSRVRKTLRELTLPPEIRLNSIMTYFTKSFNSDKSKLSYAEGACRKRCTEIVKNLNTLLEAEGLRPVNDIQALLDLLTFDGYTPKAGFDGKPVVEPGTNIPVVIFNDEKRRENYEFFLKIFKKNPISPHGLEVLHRRADTGFFRPK